MKGVSALVAAALLAVSLVGCGVPSSDGPEPLSPDIDLLGPLPTPSETEAETVKVKVAWVLGKDLRLVDRSVVAEGRQGRVDSALTALVGGPDSSEQSKGFTTLVPPDTILDPELDRHRATVDLTLATIPANQELAVGQIALTVLAIRGVRSVRFTAAGSPVSVPLPDGSRSKGPVHRHDYAKVLPEKNRSKAA
jgi:Sporulation and spore germination